MSGLRNDPETDSSGPRSGRASSQERKSKWPHTRDETATVHTQVPSLPTRLAKTLPQDGDGKEGDICPLTQHSSLWKVVLVILAQVHNSKVPGGSCTRAGRSKAGNNQGPPGGSQWVYHVVPAQHREAPNGQSGQTSSWADTAGHQNRMKHRAARRSSSELCQLFWENVPPSLRGGSTNRANY